MHFRTCKALAAAAALTFMGAAGCTDLTVEPKSTITEANVFNDPGSYRSFIAKVYAGLAVGGQSSGDGRTDIQGIDGGFSQYVRLLWKHQELPTDEAVIAWGDVGLPELNTQTWGPTNSFVVAMYYRLFFQVGMANEFLRQSTDEKLTSRGQNGATLRAEVAEYRAEARFLRALSYWHGIDMFGSIPLVTDANPLSATPPAQASRQEIYDFLVAELNDILDDLPDATPANYGRATASAANMLLAGVYTGTTNDPAALAAAQAVIANAAYQLDDNYAHLFLADNHTSPELIFAVQQDGLKTQTYGSTTFLAHASCGNSMNAADYGLNGCWWGIRLRQQVFNLFGAGDSRANSFYTNNQTVAVTSIGDFSKGIPAPKYSNRTSTGGAGQSPEFADIDFPMFRLADAYLIYAEAQLRGGGGNAAQALAYVNALRQRAYGNTSGNITAGQLTLDFILDERARELYWEAHRRTDLVRFGRLTGGTYLWAWKGGSLGGTATPAHLVLFPLPENELSANPNLTQNPGY
jgi:hypothetical protein